MTGGSYPLIRQIASTWARMTALAIIHPRVNEKTENQDAPRT